MLTTNHILGFFEIDGLGAFESTVTWVNSAGEEKESPTRIVFAVTRDMASDKHMEWVKKRHGEKGTKFRVETRPSICLYPEYLDEIEVET